MTHQPTETAKPKPSKNRFKDTLNLPKTSFPMKASLVQNEPASLKRWEQAGLYDRLVADRADAPRFVFHDGPPYANGSIHLGHMLNKVLKDLVVRSKLMAGMSCPFVPGWDCHGLPIEHKVMQELKEKGKLAKLAGLEPDVRAMAIRRACRDYAEKFVKLQSGQMRRLLTIADYEHPYITMDPAYEGATLEVFAALVEEGLVYRQLKPVHWSIENETALADAELEYHERRDPSIYVDFEAAEGAAVYERFGLDDDARDAHGLGTTPSFMIWTTTPWTLAANLAIAVHADYEYALVKMDGNVTVVAVELLEKVAAVGNAEDVETVATVKGSALAGLRYRHPFREAPPELASLSDAATRGATADTCYTVMTADYVTLDDGTGLVHTAPGHGVEDYQTGLREGLPVYCPVGKDGRYDETTPDFLTGVQVWEANALVIDRLVESGHMYHHFEFDHSYPHDWRSKTPTIFRATEQWFIGVDIPKKTEPRTLRKAAMDETAEGVGFFPAWGKNRMRGMLENRPDWCISRQRAWGLPIPAFYVDGVTILTASSVLAVAKAFREDGSDSWFEKSAAHLLRHWDAGADPDWEGAAPDLSAAVKSTDIFDVWWESGSSWNAVMRERSGGADKPFDAGLDQDVDYPIDLYLEGSDQHRGWFQLSLLPALGATGRPPFKAVLTHGFMVDKDGKKMSKSLGNALDVDALFKDFGADVCRWWVASISYEADIKVDLSFFKNAGEAYRKVRNTLRFMLSVLSDFDAAEHAVDLASLDPRSLDAWVLGEFDALTDTVRTAFDTYQFQKATTALYAFCNDTLSAIYLAAIKDRLYCDEPASERRRQTQTVVRAVCDGLSRLLAPILPHTADEAWRAINLGDGACVHEHAWLSHFGVERSPDWPTAMAARDRALKTLEDFREQTDLDNPLDAGVLVPDPKGVLIMFDPVDLADLLGVSRALPDQNIEDVAVEDLRHEPRCERSWKRDGSVRKRTHNGETVLLSDRDAQAVGAE
ncbi:MAG: isoleucine--tRNA ligase [Planctomycetota bacterium]